MSCSSRHWASLSSRIVAGIESRPARRERGTSAPRPQAHTSPVRRPEADVPERAVERRAAECCWRVRIVWFCRIRCLGFVLDSSMRESGMSCASNAFGVMVCAFIYNDSGMSWCSSPFSFVFTFVFMDQYSSGSKMCERTVGLGDDPDSVSRQGPVTAEHAETRAGR